MYTELPGEAGEEARKVLSFAFPSFGFGPLPQCARALSFRMGTVGHGAPILRVGGARSDAAISDGP